MILYDTIDSFDIVDGFDTVDGFNGFGTADDTAGIG